MLDLIQALMIEPAARILPSRIAGRTLSGDLALLYGHLDTNQPNTLVIRLVIPLVDHIIKNKLDAPIRNDEDIWLAVFDLVAFTNLKQATPPIAFNKAILDTPLRSSSASQRGAEQTHDEVDQRIIEELTGRVFYDVKGFYDRYLQGKDWSNKAGDICTKSMTQHAEGRWSGWPEPSDEGPFFDWFMKFQDTVLNGLGRRYYTSANKVLRGSEADRKLDIFLAPANVALPNSEHDWSNVLVIGEHKSNPNEDQHTKTLIQLAGYAREVFGSQPDRRFIPGFTICGSLMRLWVFDRSGPYSSEKFDIHKEPKRFVKALAGYAIMTDTELGLNTFIKRDELGRYIIAHDVKIYLEDKPIALQKAIVCRGTTCYRGKRLVSRDWDYVVKFAWPSDKRYWEGDLLKLAKERGVTGIATWFNHEQITVDSDPDTISHFRRDMDFDKPKKLSNKASWVDTGAESSRVSMRRSRRARSKSSMSRFKGLGTSPSSATTSSGRKRKEAEGFVGSSVRKRSKSSDSRSGLAKVQTKEYEPGTAIVYSIQETESDSLAGCQSETYGNRIHCCLVTSPAGRPLQDYQSVTELLEALRDAIKGHKSLLENGRILHRDISEKNIIITEPATEGDPKGMLIDLDLAKELESLRGGASYRTGTMQFMAIEVLQGKGHTYRHDLESFFYVFIWVCIRYGQDTVNSTLEASATSRLRRWYTGTYTDIADTKIGHMDKNVFENIIAEFAVKFETLKQLARKLRHVIFPIKDGAIFTGTFRDKDIMYNGMIEAFNMAIASGGNNGRQTNT